MRNQIICKGQPGSVAFFLEWSGKSYYLFNQKYSQHVFETYRNGVPINKAFEHKKYRNRIMQSANDKTIERLRLSVRYIEKEYSITVFGNQTKSFLKCA